MNYNKIGAVNIGALSLGSMYFPKNTSRKDFLHIFDFAFDSGVNYFDTSNNYENGEAETLVGEFLKNKNREEVLIGTKCFFPYGNKTKGGLSRDEIMKSVKTSLKRLNTDYIDFFFCHRFDAHTPLEETIMCIDDLMKSGFIKSWGICAFTTTQLLKTYYLCKISSIKPPIVAQYPYNLFNRTIEMDLEDAIRETNIGLITYYPLCQGVLTGKYLDSIKGNSRASFKERADKMWDLEKKKQEAVKKFVNLAQKIGCQPAVLAIKWCLHNKLVSSVLSSCSNIQQLKDNLLFLSFHLSDSIIEDIEAIFENAPINQYTGLKF